MTNRKILVNCLKLCPIFPIYVICGGVGEGEYLIFMFDWGECGLCKNNTNTYSGNLVWTDSEKTQKLKKILFFHFLEGGGGCHSTKYCLTVLGTRETCRIYLHATILALSTGWNDSGNSHILRRPSRA